MTKRLVQRGVFLLLAAALAIGAARLPTTPHREPEAPAVYVYQGYAAGTDASWDERSLTNAAHRFQHLLETYFAGGSQEAYLAVVPDKGQLTQPPEGYVPVDAAETAAWLAERLPVQTIDIAPLLTLADYYRTDPHWRQECLRPVAEALLTAMDAPVPGTEEDVLHALEGEFRGTYWDKSPEALTPDTLAFLTNDVLDDCTVHYYETDTDGGLYDPAAAREAPYDLFLSGSRSLLRIDSPRALSDRTLVVFRDSFGSSLIPLLAESYRTVYAVDIRFLASDLLGRFVDFPADADVLFLYSTAVLQNSVTMK